MHFRHKKIVLMASTKNLNERPGNYSIYVWFSNNIVVSL